MTKHHTVTVDGIEYMPSDSVFEIQIDEFRKVLEAQGWMSKSAINKIIDSLKNLEKSSDEKPISEEKTFEKKGEKGYFNYDNIVGFDDEGHVIFKKGGRGGKYSIWTMHQLKDIRHDIRMKENPYNYIRILSRKTGLSNHLVRKLILNIITGNSEELLRMWDAHRFDIKPKHRPIVNNPEKRKELGWG